MWLTSYDLDPAWGPVEVELARRASIGERADLAWSVLNPALPTERGGHSRVLLGARHQGDSVWREPTRWPMHVYVCLPVDGVEEASNFTRDQVTIEYWGLLHQTREQAELDTY